MILYLAHPGVESDIYERGWPGSVNLSPKTIALRPCWTKYVVSSFMSGDKKILRTLEFSKRDFVKCVRIGKVSGSEKTTTGMSMLKYSISSRSTVQSLPPL